MTEQKLPPLTMPAPLLPKLQVRGEPSHRPQPLCEGEIPISAEIGLFDVFSYGADHLKSDCAVNRTGGRMDALNLEIFRVKQSNSRPNFR